MNQKANTTNSTPIDPFDCEGWWGRAAWAYAGVPKRFYELIRGPDWTAIVDRVDDEHGDEFLKVVRGAYGFAQWAWKPGLFISGDVGCGKTLIVCHVIHKMILTAQGVGQPPPGGKFYESWYPEFRFINVARLITAAKSTFRRQSRYEASMDDIVKPYAEADVLVLDDMGAEAPTDWVRSFMFELVDERYGSERTTIFTSNYHLNDLARRVGARVADRIAEMCAGHIYRIKIGSYRVELAKKGMQSD